MASPYCSFLASDAIFKVEFIANNGIPYRWQVVCISAGSGVMRMGSFRYKKHAEHFKNYLEMRKW